MQKLAKRFVPVADEVFRLQRGKTADARFFQSFCEEGHYGGRTRPSDTRQGIYAVSASGRFLASVNTRRAKDMVQMLERALKRFAKLKGAERELDDARKKDIAAVRRIEDRFPEDGLVLRVRSRDLRGTEAPSWWHKTASNIDWAWFQKAEAQDFVPEELEVGARRAVPERLVSRLVRCHLVDNVRGQTSAYKKRDVQKAELAAKVTAVDGPRVTLALEGATRAQQDKGRWPRGFVSELRGRAVWNTSSQRFETFELLATGKRWGRTRFNSRPEVEQKKDPASEDYADPVGVLFELLPASRTERVAPAHYWDYGW